MSSSINTNGETTDHTGAAFGERTAKMMSDLDSVTIGAARTNNRNARKP